MQHLLTVSHVCVCDYRDIYRSVYVCCLVYVLTMSRLCAYACCICLCVCMVVEIFLCVCVCGLRYVLRVLCLLCALCWHKRIKDTRT